MTLVLKIAAGVVIAAIAFFALFDVGIKVGTGDDTTQITASLDAGADDGLYWNENYATAVVSDSEWMQAQGSIEVSKCYGEGVEETDDFGQPTFSSFRCTFFSSTNGTNAGQIRITTDGRSTFSIVEPRG